MLRKRQQAQEIEAHAERLGGPAPPPSPAPAAGGAGPSSAAASSPAAKQVAPPPAGAGGASTSAAAGPSAPGASPAGDAPAAAAEGGQSEGKAGTVELGGDRRCTISDYKGSKLVDLREWYRKDGELKPGMKGISLQVGDWNTICSAVADIDRALQQQDMSYNLYLSGKRKVSLSQFKGKTYVAVREFFLKDNQEMPGKKGLNMTPEQWDILKKGIPNISAAV
ncbi:transcriptional Coactivator p15-domain-containing protein [Dunaliella salina]|uniref:Transcriptional Coactivator p15-domain-containing protein n=1 Tax=Dunaliella salina TaxID=3046 RepID=A0ABQ7GP36_DUNSA|nr:transcriptional Coactivator p15-domain-containing protein [Dunaliella salina]|eukprot:KAF5836365.1 transcriptional Coactivator p15-domain-containing protein [Dunaliella salina]